MKLNAEEKKVLLQIARRTIDSSVRRMSVPDFEKSFSITPSLELKAGAFVTIEIDHSLRGCVGYVRSDDALFETVSKAAVSAAMHDTRFKPLTQAEMDEIEIEISVLSPMTKVEDIQTVVPGKHGLLIESGYHHGLLLPQVATEYKWDRETFLEQTCIKAGLSKNSWKRPETVLYSFTALVFNENEIKQ